MSDETDDDGPVFKRIEEDGRIVTYRQGWPKLGEPISDEIANLALEHDRFDIVAEYLHQHARAFQRHDPCATTVTIQKIADALGQRPYPGWYLEKRRPRGKPKTQAKTLMRDYFIGARVQHLIDEGELQKNAVATAMKKFGLKESAVYEAYAYYRKRQDEDQSA